LFDNLKVMAALLGWETQEEKYGRTARVLFGKRNDSGFFRAAFRITYKKKNGWYIVRDNRQSYFRSLVFKSKSPEKAGEYLISML